MGIHLYSYDWTLPYETKGDFAVRGCRAARVNQSLNMTLKLNMKLGLKMLEVLWQNLN